MSKIDLSKFLQNNYDEFVHLRALKNVIDQVDTINDQQDANITHAQSTADTAQTTATGAETLAKSKASINYQKTDGSTVPATTLNILNVTNANVDNGQTPVGKSFMALDENNKPIEMGLDNQLLSIDGALKMFIAKTGQAPIQYSSQIQNVTDSDLYFKSVYNTQADGTVDGYTSILRINGTANLDTLIQSGTVSFDLVQAVPQDLQYQTCNTYMTIKGTSVLTFPVTVKLYNTYFGITIFNGIVDETILKSAGVVPGASYPFVIIK